MTYRPVRIPRSRQLLVRGLKHRLLCWEGEERSPVVLLHGFMDCAETWQFLVDCLPRRWSLAAPDWRGFGDSEWAPGGYWFPDYLADLEALLAQLCPSPARVIGHSMGANVAAIYAGVRSESLQWLVNLEGIGLTPTQPAQAPERYAQWLDQLQQTPGPTRYREVAELARLLMRRNPRLPADRAHYLATAWTRPAPDGGLRLAFDPRHRHVNPVLYRREEAEACWGRMRIPMLLLTGEESEHRERRARYFGDELLRTRFTAAQSVSVPGVGHMMHHEDPMAVAQAIVRFADAQEGALTG